MLRKLFWIALVLPAGAVLVAFAVANRHAVRLVFDPLAPDDPSLSLEAPFFLFLILSVVVGLLIGGGAMWLTQGKWRRRARREARDAARLRRENEQLNQQLQARSEPRLPETASAE